MFRFKQFSVEDDKSTMKVGTDAVLLGAWADVSGVKSILDIGTGCGVIALMLAQRTGVDVDAVEIHKGSAEQAEENFKSSAFAGRLKVFNTSIQEFKGENKYDLIVSNPPFFSNSLLPPTSGRQLARHTTTLSFEELFEACSRLLTPRGRFALIMPEELSMPGFHCIRKTKVYPRRKEKVERYLLEYSREEKIPLEDDLILLEGGKRSPAYEILTKDFYL